MNTAGTNDNQMGVLFLAIILTLASSLCTAVPVRAHGGESHGEESFTALQALQKATELYDRLIVNGKLDESWETDLQKAEVIAREKNDRQEYRVGFHRQSGSPEAVYIFFSSDGKYSGSNFDGQW
ncbi:MAG: hypothetical protein JJV98_03685 [Desulfosarcina sp.]|nr:hypothetical protein [Desulfobacterales bacterium]